MYNYKVSLTVIKKLPIGHWRCFCMLTISIHLSYVYNKVHIIGKEWDYYCHIHNRIWNIFFQQQYSFCILHFDNCGFSNSWNKQCNKNSKNPKFTYLILCLNQMQEFLFFFVSMRHNNIFSKILSKKYLVRTTYLVCIR